MALVLVIQKFWEWDLNIPWAHLPSLYVGEVVHMGPSGPLMSVSMVLMHPMKVLYSF